MADELVDPIFGALVAQVNAPESEIYGFEIEAVWQPIEGLTFAQNICYAKGTFREFSAVDQAAVSAQANDPNFTGFTPVFIDMAGMDIGFPEWQLNGSATYEFPLAGLGNNMYGKVVLDYSFESEETRVDIFEGFVDPTETGLFALESYFLANARISIAKAEDWELSLFGKNIFDEEYLQFRGFFDSAIVEAGGQPRSWGARFTKDF